MAPRVTNQDLAERLARVEENGKASAENTGQIREQLGTLTTLSERAIRLEGSSQDHANQLNILFGKAEAAAKETRQVKEELIPPIAEKSQRIINYGAAVFGTLSIVGGLLMGCGAYFINQQGSALQGVADTTKDTAKTVTALQLSVQASFDNLDKRLSLVEVQSHGGQYTQQPVQTIQPYQPYQQGKRK